MRELRPFGVGMITAVFVSCSAASPSDALFDWATIGDVGNHGYDRQTINNALVGRGAVDYEYRVARNEVSTGQYLAFLNTFSTQSDALAQRLRPPSHWGAERDRSYGGPGVRYTLRIDVPDADRLPLIGLNWRGAAYYINWMNNDLSSDSLAIENGAYDASTFTDNPQGGFNDQDARNPGARYFLPTWDEAIKASHWDPDKFGPGDGGWWIYNDGSDTEPIGGPPGEGETSARWIDNMFGSRPAQDTPLGSYPGTTTPWGLLDASGGGGEWTETWIDVGVDVNIGRYWTGHPAGILGNVDDATFSGSDWPINESYTTLRIAATVPAPVSLAGPLIALVFTSSRRKRQT